MASLLFFTVYYKGVTSYFVLFVISPLPEYRHWQFNNERGSIKPRGTSNKLMEKSQFCDRLNESDFQMKNSLSVMLVNVFYCINFWFACRGVLYSDPIIFQWISKISFVIGLHYRSAASSALRAPTVFVSLVYSVISFSLCVCVFCVIVAIDFSPPRCRINQRERERVVQCCYIACRDSSIRQG